MDPVETALGGRLIVVVGGLVVWSLSGIIINGVVKLAIGLFMLFVAVLVGIPALFLVTAAGIVLGSLYIVYLGGSQILTFAAEPVVAAELIIAMAVFYKLHSERTKRDHEFNMKRLEELGKTLRKLFKVLEGSKNRLEAKRVKFMEMKQKAEDLQAEADRAKREADKEHLEYMRLEAECNTSERKVLDLRREQAMIEGCMGKAAIKTE